MTENFQEILNAAWCLAGWVGNFLQSNFITAFAGATGGALGAAWIIRTSEKKKLLLEDIRNTNAAIMAAFSITNTYLTVLDQHIKGLKDNYDSQVRSLKEFKKNKEAGIVPSEQPFEYVADFETFLPLQVPIEILKKILFEKISLTGRPLSLVTALSLCIDTLNEQLENRNGIILKCKESSLSYIELSNIYFGLPDENGHVDKNYPHSIEAVWRQIRDAIFFSKLLGEDLTKHGKSIAKSYGKKSPKIHSFEFGKAIEKGLIPDEENYSDWINMGKSSKDAN